MLNPYIEILARVLYNKDINPIPIPFEDELLAINAVNFMNGRTFTGSFNYSGGHVVLKIVDGLKE